jgi:hypothetical protein
VLAKPGFCLHYQRYKHVVIRQHPLKDLPNLILLTVYSCIAGKSIKEVDGVTGIWVKGIESF